jgi:hypothetical protein
MEKTEEFKWIWNKKPVLLEQLDERQLVSIKKSIEKSENKVWFGKSSDIWKIKIDEELTDKNELVRKLRNIRVNRAVENANIITYGILKCMNKR